jgi:tetratricopeptide (TPR) repeat protein
MSTATMSLPEALGRAVAAHDAGQFGEAERLCRAILGAAPDHFDATYLLAGVLHRRGRRVAALESYDRALGLRPAHPDVLNDRGVALHALNRFADALASYDAALAVRPDDADTLNNRGTTLGDVGRLEEALASHDKAAAIRPHAAAHANRGNILHRLKRREEAVASYNKALEIAPDHFVALANRGHVLHELGRFEEALASYDAALAVRPDIAETLYDRGYVLQVLERFEDAIASYDRALALRPDFAAALRDRGSALQALQRFDDAVVSYDRAIVLRPDYAEALHDRGVALQAMERLDEALAGFDAALAVRQNFVDAYNNRGNVLMELNRIVPALASYERAIALQPDHAIARLGRSLCLLLAGDLDRGFVEYESRWLVNPGRVFAQPLWLGGADISGKTILLHAEQGIGDTLQFCRYAKLVARQGAHVVLEVPREVAALLVSLDPSVQVVVRGDAVPEFDFHAPLLSLPLAFRTTLDTIPAEFAYLRAPAEKREVWRGRLGPSTKRGIGLVWAGNPRMGKRGGSRLARLRSLAFDQLAPLFGATDCAFYSLQKGEEAVAQLRHSAWRERVVDWSDALADFANTAGLIENLDLVITVDTSVAHLAGALGKPFWLMNRFNTCWRWFLERPDSPWYPTARIFRQPAYGDWDSVVANIARELVTPTSPDSTTPRPPPPPP